MTIQSIENGDSLFSIRTKINLAFAKLIPATDLTEGLLSPEDKIKINSFNTHTHDYSDIYAPLSHTHDYSPLDHSHDYSSLYAALDHTHDYSSLYAPLSHTHDYSPLDHSHDYSSLYAALDHTHDYSDIYAPLSHTHDYAALDHTHDYSTIYSPIDHIHDYSSLYAPLDHTHNGVYALNEHSHNETYASISHSHEETYSTVSHNHNDDYSSINHDHNDIYSLANHDHTNTYASLNHNHDVSNILNINNAVLYESYKNKLIIGFAGDSIAQGIGKMNLQSSFLAWNMFTDYPMDLYWNAETYANGGYNFAVGGANTATILSTQLPQIQDRPPNILFVNGGTNDGMSSISQVSTAFNNIKSLIDGAIAAGVSLVIVYPIIPRRSNDGSSSTVSAITEFNKRLFNLKSNKIIVLNPDNYLLDKTSKFYIPIGTDGESQAVLTDGVHLSEYGNFVQQPLLKQIFKKSLRIPKATHAGDVFHATNTPNGNVLGSDGLMIESGGELNSVPGNVDVAKGWKLMNTGGLIVTPSLVTLSNGYKAQQLVLSGTPASTGDEVKFSITKYNAAYFATNNAFDFEIVVEISDFINLSSPEIYILLTGGSPTFPIYKLSGGFGSGTVKSNFISSNYTINFYNTMPITANTSNRQFEIVVKIGGFVGEEISGTMKISNVGIFGYVI